MILSRKQLERQDVVDNAIFQLIQEVNPSDADIDWNIELIGEIRDKVQNIFVENLALCSEQNFYSFFDDLIE